jgi:DNA-binding beta-propeller fold protein YncE
MQRTKRTQTAKAVTALTFLLLTVSAGAQDNPYRVVDAAWGALPEGRSYGAISALHPGLAGTMWVADRCGRNSCLESDVDPILHFDASGKLINSFGAGLLVWPHGMDVDADGNVWVADAQVREDRGNQVLKFSPDGELLLSLGLEGRVDGDRPDSFTGPTDVLVTPTGDIFVLDGHGPLGNNRVVKFSSAGELITSWGKTGSGVGEFRDPHAIDMDSQGRIFVGDRGNARIQIFDQDGHYIATWTQFGKPSDIFIDTNDVMYVADSESHADAGNPGYRRGIRIGSVRDGWVTAFIPDPEPHPEDYITSGAEGVTADAMGNVYGGEVTNRTLVKYARR